MPTSPQHEAGFIRAIFFDAGDTLFQILPWPFRLLKAARQLGMRIRPDHAKEAMEGHEAHMVHVPKLLSRSDEEALELALSARVLVTAGIPDPDGSRSRALYQKTYWADHTVVFPEVNETLDRLVGQSMVLGVISNAPPSMHEALGQLGLAPYFRTVVVSRSVGISKPHPDIYHLALREVDVPPGECLFVDDLERNLETAAGLGMQVLLMDRGNRLEHSRFRRITDLRAVLDLCEG